MKKIIITLLLSLLFGSNDAEAKPILNVKSKKVIAKSWWMYFEDMDDKTKSTRVLENIRFKVQDENTLIDDDNSDGDGTRSSKMVNYIKKSFPNSTETIFINGSSHHNGIIKISDDTYMKICFRGENKMENLVLLKVYSQEEKFVRDIVKNYDKSPNYRILEEKLKAYMSAWNNEYAAQKAEQDKKNDAVDANFELPKPSSFAPLSQKILMQAANEKLNSSGKNKITYCYFAPAYNNANSQPQTKWVIKKEKKLVNGTYDDVITKRSLDVIIVMQYAESDDFSKKKYSVSYNQIVEDAAYGVYDGSKFSGKYYLMSFGANLNSSVPEKNALKYKTVLK